MLTPINVRMRPELKRTLEHLASRGARSLSFYITDVVENHVIGFGCRPPAVDVRPRRAPSLPNGELFAAVTIRVPKPLKQSLEKLSAADRRSVSSYVNLLLEAHTVSLRQG